MIVAGVLGLLVLFSVVLRIALAPLYQEVAEMQHGGGESYAGGGGDSGGEEYGSNVNINLGGLGGWLNWALGWAWGGPGWYGSRPGGGGWWGGNWWNGSNNTWDRNGDRVFNNDTFNRTVERDGNLDRLDRNEFSGDRDALRGGEEHFHGGGGGGFHGGGRR